MLIKTLFLLFFCISSAIAHQTGISYLELYAKSSQNIDVVYKKPLEDTQADAITIEFPASCQRLMDSSISISNGYIIEKFSLSCTEQGLNNSRIWVEGLLSSDKGVMFRYENQGIVESSLLKSSTPFVLIGQKSSTFKLFTDYFYLGVVHILIGFDHLLFVLSLLLLVTNIRVLLLSITAFTLSHSLSLGLAIFDLISVPSLYVEAMIALSILFLARELVINTQDSFTSRHLSLVAFIFGLLHGLGFSTVLTDIGLPQNEIPLTLFSFNVGIEIGQLIFIFCVGALWYILKKFLLPYQEKMKKTTAYTIGVIAAFWFIERLLAF